MTDAGLLRKHCWVSVRVGEAQCWEHEKHGVKPWACVMPILAHDLDRYLDSAQSTCAKLHDLNHMQAQRIEVLETQYATAFRERAEAEVTLAETQRECTTLKTQCETRAKRIYELEQELIDAGLDRR